MIKEIKNKPKKVFDHLDDNLHWYGLYYKDFLYAHVGIDIYHDVASFHVDVKVWNHHIYKELTRDWEELKTICRDRGVKILLASNKEIENSKWIKFIKMFGFPEPENVALSKQEL